MKKGFTTLADFAKEIERIESVKQDYVVTHEGIKLQDDTALRFTSNGLHACYTISDYAHGQIASKLGIPKRYYDEMKEVPGLRTYNVNAWLDHNKEGYFVRTKDKTVRVVLSPRYRVLDNMPILQESIFPVLQDHASDLQVKSYNLSDQKMYLQLVFPSIMVDIDGDVLNYGLTITNSEVGAGAFDVKSFVWRQVCSNGLVAESLIRKYHVGKTMDTSTEDARIYAADTLSSELNTYKLKIRDVVQNALRDRSYFDGMVVKVKEAMNMKIEAPLTEAVKNVTKRYSGIVLESDADSIIKTIIMENRYDKWGMVNGITALAHAIENPDRQYAVEKAGVDLLNMTHRDWARMVA